ncbi:MAG: hypothetical protein K0Q59_4612 [Paenibacillus sp.]|jgi:hypothetical protein|nr:hypothetical protein [Paenibacillus sp.]
MVKNSVNGIALHIQPLYLHKPYVIPQWGGEACGMPPLQLLRIAHMK